jgi:hypothetical protein
VLHIIVSIDKQRATLFADGLPFASTAISSGTPGHPTPTGVFTVIQKSRHHVSNLYGAAMPYMQRITWSGSALHQGPLPGYPASHGCVRLTEGFAQLLWKATKMGARVIVTRPDVAPIEFDHARLFVPRPKMVEAPKLTEAASKLADAQRAYLLSLANPVTTSTIAKAAVAEAATAAAPAKVKTADAANATAVAVTSLVGDASKPVATSIETDPVANASAAEQPTKLAVTDGAGSAPETGAATTAAVEPVETKAVEAQSAEAKPAAVEQPKASPANTAAVEIPLAVAKSVVAIPAQHVPIMIDERPKTMPTAVVQEANRRPISVFASLKEGKLYVRQGWKPLFDAPISFENPGQPVGTHVYTAMDMKADGKGLRWTVVMIPSNTRRIAELKETGRKSRSGHVVTPMEVEAPLPSPSAALDRIVMAPELVERISELMMPGSSLIVSDNKLSDETGEYTDFIVLTR